MNEPYANVDRFDRDEPQDKAPAGKTSWGVALMDPPAKSDNRPTTDIYARNLLVNRDAFVRRRCHWPY